LARAFIGNRFVSFYPNNPLNFQQFYQHWFNLTCNFSLQFCSRLFYSVGNNFNHVVVLTGLEASRKSAVGWRNNKRFLWTFTRWLRQNARNRHKSETL